jgi:MazG family protein
MPLSFADVRPIDRLIAIMAALRHPDTGCPWDLEQTFASIAPYTIEEAYEVDDAIRRGDLSDLKEELGDLLLQVVFHSRMAQEDGAFAFDDVASAIADKMLARHPHVFGEASARDADAQTKAWEEHKAAERARKATARPAEPVSALDGVALALPALLRAVKLQKRAARVGFDWADPAPVYDKLAEETTELRAAQASGDPQAILEEMGDLLFVVANLARQFSVEPEEALRRANAKFERRFRAMESLARARGLDFAALDLTAQDALWNAVKQDERAAASPALP